MQCNTEDLSQSWKSLLGISWLINNMELQLETFWTLLKHEENVFINIMLFTFSICTV